jgi:hypothetical protein
MIASSNMVAAQALKKLPVDKDDWITEYKTYIVTQAREKFIWDHLQGQAVAPVLGGNTLKHQEIYDKKLETFKIRENAAWKFIYDICEGTHLKSIITTYENEFDYVSA